MVEDSEMQEGSVLLAMVRRLLGSDHWCESWAHGCTLDSSLAVLERVSPPRSGLGELEALPLARRAPLAAGR